MKLPGVIAGHLDGLLLGIKTKPMTISATTGDGGWLICLQSSTDLCHPPLTTAGESHELSVPTRRKLRTELSASQSGVQGDRQM